MEKLIFCMVGHRRIIYIERKKIVDCRQLRHFFKFSLQKGWPQFQIVYPWFFLSRSTLLINQIGYIPTVPYTRARPIKSTCMGCVSPVASPEYYIFVLSTIFLLAIYPQLLTMLKACHVSNYFSNLTSLKSVICHVHNFCNNPTSWNLVVVM